MSEYVSVLEMFSVGIGPSSSHTVGPMRAAHDFAASLSSLDVSTIRCELAGSLASTGVGHGTPAAVYSGLGGAKPETCDPQKLRSEWENLPVASGTLELPSGRRIQFGRNDITFHPFRRHPAHPNSMTFHAMLADGAEVSSTYLSIGGGFIARDGDQVPQPRSVPFLFRTGAELLEMCQREGTTIAELVRRNEIALHGDEALDAGLDAIWQAMDSCIEAGLKAEGTLPGGLDVRRRAASMRGQLELASTDDDWLSAFALAVNEENAAGSRVVTAPTNGAAGIIPAIIKDHLRRNPLAGASTVREMLLTASAIGWLAKRNASISGAEVGCQGEVGSACAMAAAGLTAVLGGTPMQVENAAEIAIEHHLGLTCDPVGGLVQIPCIERNAVAASTARTATRLALRGDGSHRVAFDTAIETMRQTGADMSHKYKETSEAGLAVNVVEC